MGRLTETLRGDSLRRGGDYELQGSDAHKGECTPVTSLVDGTMVGPTGPLESRKPSVSPGDLKSSDGQGKI